MKEVTHEDWQKNPTPRMMWVWDNEEILKVKRKVVCVLRDNSVPNKVIAIDNYDSDYGVYRHCAEIEKQRRMTNKELSRWLREKPTREYKYSNSIEHRVYSTYTYDEDAEEEEVRKDVVIREDDSDWREPLVEVEE